MSADEEDPFMALFEEFEAFKATSQQVEEQQAKTIDELNAEVRRLKRLAAEADNGRQQYLDRLNAATAGEEDLRTELHQLKEAAAEAKRERVRLENEVEKLSNEQRKAQFTATRLTSEAESLADKVIMLEADVEEARAEAAMQRGNASHAKALAEEAGREVERLRAEAAAAAEQQSQKSSEAEQEKGTKNVAENKDAETTDANLAASSSEQVAAASPSAFSGEGPCPTCGHDASAAAAAVSTTSAVSHTNSYGNASDGGAVVGMRSSSVATLGSTTMSLEAAEGLHAVAERLRRIADKCRQRPAIGVGYPSSPTTSASPHRLTTV